MAPPAAAADATPSSMAGRTAAVLPPDARSPRVAIIGDLDADRLQVALRPPCMACVEFAFGQAIVGPRLRSTLEAGGLYLSLSTIAAYGLAPAQAFSAAVGRRAGAAACDGMELAVHEATANALLHGNLATCVPRESADDMMLFYQTVDLRLAERRYAARCLELAAVWSDSMITVSIANEGEGFDAASWRPGSSLSRKSGRGLALIHGIASAVRFSAGGRCIHMSFAR